MSATFTLAEGAIVLAGENQKSGPIGLAVILVLCAVSYLLFRSMSRHMRKVREEFPDNRDATAAAAQPPVAGADPAQPTDPAPADGADAPEDGAPA